MFHFCRGLLHQRVFDGLTLPSQAVTVNHAVRCQAETKKREIVRQILENLRNVR